MHDTLIAMLQAGHSKIQMQCIVQYIGNDKKKFDALMHLFLTGDYRTIQRAAWPLSNAAIGNPALIKKHFGAMLLHMKSATLHPAVRRNVLRILTYIELPQKYHGILITECIHYITDAKEAIAVQAFSLSVLQKLTQLYPDIRQEVTASITAKWPNATPAFRSRAKAYLQSQ